MRVFDTYYFDIGKRVSFARTASFLDVMLWETGFVQSRVGFSVYNTHDENLRQTAVQYPQLTKYTVKSAHCCGLTSASANINDCMRGNIFADAADTEQILSLFGRIPRPLGFTFCTLLLGGIKWYRDSKDIILPDTYDARPFEDTLNAVDRFSCNSVRLSRTYGDGAKTVTVSVCIDATAAPVPRDTSQILKVLTPYLGKPEYKTRTCLFSQEEAEKLDPLKIRHAQALRQLLTDMLPSQAEFGFENRGTEQPAKTALIAKIFRGTGFEKEPGMPGWMSTFSCTDANGFRYEANIQRLSGCGGFRLWMEITGCNFRIKADETGRDYYGAGQDGARRILEAFAAYCVHVRDAYSKALAADFDITPDWFRQ